MPTSDPLPTNIITGLRADQVKQHQAQFGLNEVAIDLPNPLRVLISKFWSPIPWMLEATIILELALHKIDEAIVILVLLVINAVLSFFQEDRANKALALLRQRLNIQARVLRDNVWKLIPARELTPEDMVHIRMGDIIPADLQLIEGQVQIDQSTITGESLPIEAGPGATAYSGAIVTRGEASAKVVSIGTKTHFGQTAVLVRSANTVSHLESMIFTIIKYLVIMDVVLVIVLLIYADKTNMPLSSIFSFVLILLIASVPVALPATFTLATTLGALELAKEGVLVTRLSAIEEAAGMDILACDKTGTITENKLILAALKPAADTDETTLLQMAAFACDSATQDPIDLAILAAARDRKLVELPPKSLRLVPFDPQTRRSERYFDEAGITHCAMKGAALEVAALAGIKTISDEVSQLTAQGYRVLGVAFGEENKLRFAGLIALQDPPRKDSSALIATLRDLGIRVVMITGDSVGTAQSVAKEVGIGARACTAQMLNKSNFKDVNQYDVFAQVFPADKYRLVENFQQAGHITGMTGDGVNDAPALKQAEVGIAVASATDVAKAAASLVLTNPGLLDVITAVNVSRQIYQRMLTYTLNKIIKTLEIAIFMSVGVMLTGVFVITPLLMVLLMFTNDFVTMAIATDRVNGAKKPERWNISALMFTAAPLAACMLALSFSVFFVGRDYLHLPLDQLQTLIFIMLIFTGLGNVFIVRERRHFWQSRPSWWMIIATVLDIIVVSIMAIQGYLITAISPTFIAALFLVVLCYLALIDFVKVKLFARFHQATTYSSDTKS